jgi:hypothetical protein
MDPSSLWPKTPVIMAAPPVELRKEKPSLPAWNLQR